MTGLLGFSLLIGLVAAIVAGSASVVFGEAENAFASSIGAGISAAIVEFAVLWLAMPTFAHWTDYGYFATIAVVMAAATLSTFLTELQNQSYRTSYGASIATSMLGLVGILLFLLLSVLIMRPVSAHNDTWDEAAALLQLRDATPEEIALSATEADLLKIAPETALLHTRGEIPSGVGSYASPHQSFEQKVGDQQVYITDLEVTDWFAFRRAGRALPGYFTRSAKEAGGETVFVPGHTLRYVPGAKFLHELERHVYVNYTYSCGCVVDHLDVLEVDDQEKPLYTGTVWEYAVGNVGLVATGVIVVDPETGEITPYSIADAPAWINRVYSLEKIDQRVGWWVEYSGWDALLLVNNNQGRMRVDSSQDVYGANGELYYSYTISDYSADQTIIAEIRVNPRTAEAVRYPAQGRTLQAVKSMIATETTVHINPAAGSVVPVECERQVLLGVPSYYCILISGVEGDNENGPSGYAFLQERYANESAKVVMNQSFDAAWNAFRLQITQGATDTALVQAQSGEPMALLVTVVRESPTWKNDVVVFVGTIANREGNFLFLVDASNQQIGFVREGDLLELAAYYIESSDDYSVVSIRNLTLCPPENPQTGFCGQ